MNYEQALAAIAKIEEELNKIKDEEKLNAYFLKIAALLIDENMAKTDNIIRSRILNSILMKLMSEDVSPDNMAASKLYNHVKSKHPCMSLIVLSELEIKFNKVPLSKNHISNYYAENESSDSETEDTAKLGTLLRSLTRDWDAHQTIENHLGISVLNRKGDFIYLNKRAQELLGLEGIKTHKKLNFWEIQPAASRNRLLQKFGPRIFKESDEPSKPISMNFVVYSPRKINPSAENKKIRKICKKKDFSNDQQLFRTRYHEIMRTACVNLVGKILKQRFRITESIWTQFHSSKNFYLSNIPRPSYDCDSEIEEIKNKSAESMLDGQQKKENRENQAENIIDKDLVVMVIRKSVRFGCPSYVLNADPQIHEREYMDRLQE